MKIKINKKKIKLIVNNNPLLMICSLKRDELENLRKWKNQNKNSFFFQKEISKTNHQKWFNLYEKRPYDLIFVSSFKGNNFGCMGIRWKNNKWDVYNLILGEKNFGNKGYMSKTFALMIKFAKKLKNGNISAKVLKENPAVSWYNKQGFKISKSFKDYYLMEK